MIFLTQTLVRNYEVDQYKGAKTSRKNYHLEVTPIFLSEIIYLHTQTRNLTTDYDQNNWRLIAGLGSVTPPQPSASLLRSLGWEWGMVAVGEEVNFAPTMCSPARAVPLFLTPLTTKKFPFLSHNC